MYLRCTYVSRATRPLSAAELYDIIRVAQNRNTTLGITGALMYADGYFAQCLEGDPFQVTERIAVIRRDPRHTDFEIRATETVAALIFPDHWMAMGGATTLIDERSVALGFEPGFRGTLEAPDALLALLQHRAAPDDAHRTSSEGVPPCLNTARS